MHKPRYTKYLEDVILLIPVQVVTKSPVPHDNISLHHWSNQTKMASNNKNLMDMKLPCSRVVILACFFAAKYLYREDAGKDANREVGWGFIWVIILGLAAVGLGGYAVYKYRIRVWLFCFVVRI